MTGPFFLLFYLAAGVSTVVIIKLLIRLNQSSLSSQPSNLTDPYQIAMLRGGEQEAIRIAVVSLIDRGLLKFDGVTLQTAHPQSIEFAKRKIEIEVLKECLAPTSVAELYSKSSFRQACTEYHTSLKQQGLIISDSEKQFRDFLIVTGYFIAIGLAVAKIFVALRHGHANILFLVVLMVAQCSILNRIQSKIRTRHGNQALADLRSLFQGLMFRAEILKPGGETNEFALLAAVFGLSALPIAHFPSIRNLLPAKNRGQWNDDTDGTSGCGSGCGSSCGGGCGGGCGGCGS